MHFPPYKQIFSHTQNSYKFYWWLAIIEIVVEEQKSKISYEEIVLKIICKLWYPVNFFKLSFGKQDKCANYIAEIKKQLNIKEDIDEKDLMIFLLKNKNSLLLQRISNELTRYVPFRFIRPWYSTQTRSIPDQKVNQQILELQNSDAPYIINAQSQTIFLEVETIEWIIRNYRILEAHTLFELLKYLEKNNLNVSNLSRKLVKPQQRNLGPSIKLWTGFIQDRPTQTDIFEKKRLNEISNMSIDHFLPWSFVTHDLIWNLHPVEKSINSQKSNLIPSIEYLEEYSSLQYLFSRFLLKKGKIGEIENYCVLFKCTKADFSQIPENRFQDLLIKFYLPQMEIASNMGFVPNWYLR